MRLFYNFISLEPVYSIKNSQNKYPVGEISRELILVIETPDLTYPFHKYFHYWTILSFNIVKFPYQASTIFNL